MINYNSCFSNQNGQSQKMKQRINSFTQQVFVNQLTMHQGRQRTGTEEPDEQKIIL